MSSGLSACMCVSFCVCQTERPLVYPSTGLFAPLFIICLSSFFLSSLSVPCLSLPPGFPNVKWQQREKERVAYIFNGGFLYFNEPSFSLPSFGSVRREDEETDGGENNINKLHINWSAAGLDQTFTQPRPLTHCPRFKTWHRNTDKPNHAAGNNMECLDFTFSMCNLLVLSVLTQNSKLWKKTVSRSCVQIVSHLFWFVLIFVRVAFQSARASVIWQI